MRAWSTRKLVWVTILVVTLSVIVDAVLAKALTDAMGSGAGLHGGYVALAALTLLIALALVAFIVYVAVLVTRRDRDSDDVSR